MELNSEKIKKLLTVSKNLNLVVTKPVKFYKEYQKSDVYNPDIDEPLHKVWVKTPFSKTLNPAKFKDELCRDMSLGFAPMTKDIKIFCTKLKRIESYVASKLDKKHRSSIKKLNDYMVVMNVKTPSIKNRFNFTCYGPDNRKLDFGDIEKGEKLSGFIELSEVWIKDDEIGFNWSFLQCKVYKTFDFDRCLFDDDGEVPENKDAQHFTNNFIPRPNVVSSIPPPPPPLCLPQHNTFKLEQSQIGVSRFIPTAQDLLGALNRLKPAKKDHNNEDRYNLDLEGFDNDILDKELDCIEIDENINKDRKTVDKIVK